ncbi:MAG TPA: iron ABC transporter permease [Ktedonobacterales bacterium]|nr:iron ABC transporter permease [Ktedonobacterales bacterium]
MARETLDPAAPAQPEHIGAEAEVSASPFAPRRHKRGSWTRALVAFPVLVVMLFGSVVLAEAFSSVFIEPIVTAQVLLNATGLFDFPRTWPVTDEIILLTLRLPSVLGAVLVGAALGIAGAMLQGLLRNPLADPFLLGTSSGAALGASAAFLLPAVFTASLLGFSLLAGFAFLGALLAAALVYALATSRGRTPVVSLLLAGVAVSALLSALQTLIIIFNDRQGFQIRVLYLWLAGGVRVGSWAQVWVVAALVALGLLGALLLAPSLDVFALGEEMAAHLGLAVERRKVAVVALSALLVAGAVAISGLVGFVGLVVPHVFRILLGPRHRLLIPASALGGAIFVTLADLLARTAVAPAVLPLGALTALVGGPFFLALLRAAGRRYQW